MSSTFSTGVRRDLPPFLECMFRWFSEVTTVVAIARPPRIGGRRFLLLTWRSAEFTGEPRTLNSPPETPSPPPPAAPASDQVHGIVGWRRALLWPLGLLANLWGRTLRFETTAEDLAAYQKRDVPVAIILWHNRLFLAAEIVRRFRKGRTPYALVSASQDGAWLSAFFSIVGLRSVRGSSSRLGREAATALVEVLRAGYDIGITPDGPRGPCYEVKPGTLIVTRRTRTPMVLVGAEFSSAWRLKSWDKFYLPKPFSKVRMRSEVVPFETLDGDRDEATARLQARLLAINPDPKG